MSVADNLPQNPSASEDVLIVLAQRDVVLFPGVVLPLAIQGKRAVAAAQEAVRTQRRIGVLLQKDESEEPGADALHRVGTIASILRFVTAPDGTHHVICQGEERFVVLDYVSQDPFFVARIERHKDPAVLDRDVEARGINLREKALEALQLLPQAPAELANAVRGIESISTLADIIASFMDLKPADKQELLATFDLKTRLDRILALVNRRVEVLKVSRQIDERTREAFDERQKEAVLRERLRQI
jgi:ATP-dependent Lon protease